MTTAKDKKVIVDLHTELAALKAERDALREFLSTHVKPYIENMGAEDNTDVFLLEKLAALIQGDAVLNG